MNTQKKKYVPVSCYVDENWMDIGGNIYPKEGLVTSKEFTDDINIQFGLYGILWGQTDYLLYEKTKNSNWVVVKVELDNNFIVVDKFHNRVKFKDGMILCSGSIRKTGRFLWNNRNVSSQYFCDPPKDIKEEEIVGTSSWMKEFRGKN